ncbi:MAG: OmcA/MtrC family decaheme c-type cytochrome [bacterium]
MQFVSQKLALRAAILLVALAWLSACGDDGRAGRVGPAGPQGPPGPAAPPNPPSGGTPIDAAERIDIEVHAVEVSTTDKVAVVQFRLTNDLGQGLVGLSAGDIRFVLAQLTEPEPGSGASSQWQSYITRADGGVADVQAATETGSLGTFVDNGDGTYSYTFAHALDAYPSGPNSDSNRTHRIGIEIRGRAPTSDNGVYDFVPAGGMGNSGREIVDNETCNACHDVLQFHGGARSDVRYCVTCHNPSSIDGNTGNTVDMTAMIHNIHAGRDGYLIVGFGGTPHDYSDVLYTQDIRNCGTCHQENDSGTPQASNWHAVANRVACGTCHFEDGDPSNGIHDFAIEAGQHPGGLNFSDDTQCLDCHGPNSTVTDSTGALVRTNEVHRLPGLEASSQFVFNIIDARNLTPGGFVEIDYSVTDSTGQTYDLETAPEFTACSDGTSRLALNIGWSTSDFTNSGSGSPNAAPISVNALGGACNGAGSDVDGDGVYTVQAAVPLPSDIVGSIAVALEGHPGTDLNGDGVIAGRQDQVAVTTAIAYYGIAGDPAVPRRSTVAVEKCGDCHKQLVLHGNNRTDTPQACAMCHNPDATDILVRVAGSDCEAVLGLDDQSIDMKFMMHGIHAGLIGICGFRNSAHDYSNVVYPGRLNNCEGCHVPDGYYPVEPGDLLATTLDANDPSTPTDDRVMSPNASACSGCHNSQLAIEHMKQNGSDFNATKAADSSLISSGFETCLLCHGPGRSADVKEVHRITEFDFN